MNQTFRIRKERASDSLSISRITKAAFEPLPISNHTEHLIIDELRRKKALTISLVVEQQHQIIGHIAFSPVTISDGTENWFGLGPISVLPQFQKKGIGKALIREGLKQLKQVSAAGCCLVGHPEYYGRFGFENPQNLSVQGVPSEAFFSLSFGNNLPQGTVCFHEAFLKNYESDEVTGIA